LPAAKKKEKKEEKKEKGSAVPTQSTTALTRCCNPYVFEEFSLLYSGVATKNAKKGKEGKGGGDISVANFRSIRAHRPSIKARGIRPNARRKGFSQGGEERKEKKTWVIQYAQRDC